MNPQHSPETRRKPIHRGSSPVRPPWKVEVQVLQEQKAALRVEVSGEYWESRGGIINRTALLILLSIAAFLLSIPSNAVAVNAFYWSVDIKHKKDSFKIVTQSHLIGERKLRHYKLGDYRKVIQSGRFELGVLPLISTKTEEVASLQACYGHSRLEKLAGNVKLLEKYLKVPPDFQRVRFELVLVPRDTRFNLRVSQKFTNTMPLRLAMPMPKNKVNCGQWWDKVLNKYIHEFIHAYHEMSDFPRLNDESYEVIAYSLVNCLSLKSQSPAQVFPDWYQASGEFHFKKEYEDIISGKVYKPAKLAKQPTIIGNGITLLNFYHLYGDSYPETPTLEQSNAVNKYCHYVGSTPHDYMKINYFERQN